jgi:tetratricopeptide (TPR) repeat protein
MVSITLATVLGLAAHGLGLAGQSHTTELAPLYLYPWSNMGEMLIQIDREEEAVEALDHALRLEPTMPHALLYRTVALVNLGRTDEAAASYARVQSLPEGALPEHTLRMLDDILALAEATRNGDEAAAHQHALGVVTTEFELRDIVASTLHHQGRTEEIVGFLATLGSEPDKSLPWDMLVSSPATAPLVDRPEVQPLLAHAQRDFDAQMAVLAEAESRGELPDWLRAPLAEQRALRAAH